LKRAKKTLVANFQSRRKALESVVMTGFAGFVPPQDRAVYFETQASTG